MTPEERKLLEESSLIDSRLAYKGRRLSLRLNTYQFEKRTKIAEIVEHPGAVVIVPIDPDGKIILVQQWRRATKEILIELPAGTLEEGEEPAACAQRELQEETGYRAESIEPLGGFYSAPGYTSEYLHLYAAKKLSFSPLPPDDDEAIDLLSIPLDEVLDLIRENGIRDAKTIAGIFRYQLSIQT